MTPAAPTVTAGVGQLTVGWTEPGDNGTSITQYSVRHIRTDATDKSDGQWTEQRNAWRPGGGALSYTIGGLSAGVSYDVQVRASTSNGRGDWSATTTGTPTGMQPAMGTITWAGSFTEAAANNGSVTGSVTATLTGDTFTSGVATGTGVDGGRAFPMGLIVVPRAERRAHGVHADADRHGDNAHANSNDVSDLTVTFASGAFTTGDGGDGLHQEQHRGQLHRRVDRHLGGELHGDGGQQRCGRPAA